MMAPLELKKPNFLNTLKRKKVKGLLFTLLSLQLSKILLHLLILLLHRFLKKSFEMRKAGISGCRKNVQKAERFFDSR